MSLSVDNKIEAGQLGVSFVPYKTDNHEENTTEIDTILNIFINSVFRDKIYETMDYGELIDKIKERLAEMSQTLSITVSRLKIIRETSKIMRQLIKLQSNTTKDLAISETSSHERESETSDRSSATSKNLIQTIEDKCRELAVATIYEILETGNVQEDSVKLLFVEILSRDYLATGNNKKIQEAEEIANSITDIDSQIPAKGIIANAKLDYISLHSSSSPFATSFSESFYKGFTSSFSDRK